MICVLSCCPAKAGKCARTLHTPTALLSSSAISLNLAGLCNLHGMLLDSMALVGRGDLHSWVPRNCNNQKDSSWGATNPGHCTDSRLKDILSISVKKKKKPIYLSWSFSLRVRLSVGHKSRSYRGALRESGPGDAIFVFSLCLAIVCRHLPDRRLYTYVKPRFLQLLPRGHLQITWFGGQQGLWLWFHRNVYICTIWKLLLEGLASNQPELGADWYPSLWKIDRSWHTLNNRDLSRIYIAA